MISCLRLAVADKRRVGVITDMCVGIFSEVPHVNSARESVSCVSQRLFSFYSIIQKPPLRCSADNVPQCFAEVKKDMQLQSDLVTMDSTFHKSGFVALSLWKMETVSGSASKQQIRPESDYVSQRAKSRRLCMLQLLWYGVTPVLLVKKQPHLVMTPPAN